MTAYPDYPYKIAAVERTLKLIEILAINKGNLTISEIAKKLDVHISSADRYLLTLQSMGYVDKDILTGRFKLSDRILKLNDSLIVDHPLSVRYLDTMHTLAYEFNTTTHIMAFYGRSTITLHKDLQTHNMSFNNAFFDPKRYHYCSAPGKLLLSTLSEKDLTEYFAQAKFIRFTQKTMTSEAEVREDLERIRQRGYSTHDEEWLVGNLTIAYPLRVGGRIKGALSLMCDIAWKDRMLSKKTVDSIKARLKEPIILP